VACSEQAGLGVGYEEPDEGQGDDVEEADAPEDLFDSCGERFARVGRLGCCEADEFGAGEGEGSGDKYADEAFEAVVEGSGVRPVFSANVAAGGGAADVDNDS
jgi:hypothetical protein